MLQYGIIVKKSETLPGDEAMRTAITLGDYIKLGFEQDVQIWRHKARIDNPLLVEEEARYTSCAGGINSSTSTPSMWSRIW